MVALLPYDLAVVIPALNEQQFIGAALRSIADAAADVPMRVGVMVLANNCTDRTVLHAREAGARHGLSLHVPERRFQPRRRGAGHARRLAMQAAASLCAPDGVLVSTDADATLMPGTLAAVSEAIRAGADLVCGSISTVLPAAIAHSPSIQRIDAATAAYADLVHEVRFAIDRLYGTQPEGPRPHYVESGACLALTVALHERIGGLPDVASSEDRALVRSAEASGARVSYSHVAHARVSARTFGRAAGGMAEALRVRLSMPDPLADQALTAPGALRREWRLALDSLPRRRRPAPGTAHPPLRASDLERELPALRSFVDEVVRPTMSDRSDAAPGDDLRVA